VSGLVAVERPRSSDGLPTVFAVTAIRDTAGCRPESFRVQVPVRPNGSTRWVDAQALRILWVDTRIVVHVGSMRLELQRGGRIVLRSPIAPGAPETPTPLGHFYVTKRLIPKDPNGPWGPAALGTSAFSPVLKSWVEGGPIGIHGTNEPGAIGHAASHGCIRLPNAMMKRLFAQVPAGTPVVIRR
jgi:lipoprotein-anchoring transpeptidase ErfK/SrfK